MTRLILSLLFLSFVAIACQQKSHTIEKSDWRGPNRDGFYPDQNLLKEWPEQGPELLWSYEDLGKGYTTVAVTEDMIYTTGTFDSTSFLIALDHDGKLVWKKEYGNRR